LSVYFWQTSGKLTVALPQGLAALELVVTVGADVIIVKTLGFYAAYGGPDLILRRHTDTDDQELLAEVWRAATDKARELGWIV
jgi:hypothetical protein